MAKLVLENVRNIGISAHIDSGKTTLTERILFYTGKIHEIHEVRGKDGVGATMDSMDLEKEKGITIQSACTQTSWVDYNGTNRLINIIDTPGHVDFTIEVERSLRVLDGAILVLCGTSGVQSQSITVDRQMRRYKVPRVAFINKLDNPGSDAFKVTAQLREKLYHNAIMFQIPIGRETELKGVIDLIEEKAYYFEGEKGITVIEKDVPADMLAQVAEYRAKLIDALTSFSDEMTDLCLEEKEVPKSLIYSTARAATIAMNLTPVFMGSAYRNVGVQKLLDGVSYFLPCPTDVKNIALDIDDGEKETEMISDDSKPFVGYVFKLEDGKYGQLSYMRVYQGHIKKGDAMFNMSTTRKHSVGRLMRMHSNKPEDIDYAGSGDIVAVFGIDCSTGTTFTDGTQRINMTSMHVPKAVIDMKIDLKDRKNAQNLSKALNRFTKEDPTFRVRVDEESGETIISGMGELHLEIYVERMKREYAVDLDVGQPQVAYRESISQNVTFDYSHKKQTGGRGQYAKVVGRMEVITAADETEDPYLFVSEVSGGSIPKEFIPACDKGFASCMLEGRLIGFPVTGVKCILVEGGFHAVDSDELSFRLAARGAFRQAYDKAKPAILEPIMKVAIETPTEFQGTIMGNLNSRRGVITGTHEEYGFCRVSAEVPLSEMFGYVGELRSMSQGKAEYSMEFGKYAEVPRNIHTELVKKFAASRKMKGGDDE